MNDLEYKKKYLKYKNKYFELKGGMKGVKGVEDVEGVEGEGFQLGLRGQPPRHIANGGPNIHARQQRTWLDQLLLESPSWPPHPPCRLIATRHTLTPRCHLRVVLE